MSGDPYGVVPALRDLQRRMVAALWPGLRAGPEELSRVEAVQGGDTIYRLDRNAEELLLGWCEEWGRREGPFVLIAEGLEAGLRTFPQGARTDDTRLRLLIDPVDGTRGLMYDKRSAWILAGAAPNRGPETSLGDIRWAVMTEIPTSRSFLADQYWATAGEGAAGVTLDLSTDPPREAGAACIRPSRATDLRHGFASLVKYFPGGKELTARLEEALFAGLLGPPVDGTPQVFDDEYISSGGQLAELIRGHDRFVADLRPLVLPRALPGEPVARLCAHPYDLCTELIAREAGVEVAAPDGSPLDAPLDLHHNLAWAGYANRELRRTVEPALQRLLREEGLLP